MSNVEESAISENSSLEPFALFVLAALAVSRWLGGWWVKKNRFKRL